VILWTILGSIISGAFYRIGGAGKEEIPWAKGWMRDAGCTVTFVACMALTGHWHWSLLLCAVLMYFALTTYWDEFPLNNGEDNFWMYGGFVGLAVLPFLISGASWLLFGLIVARSAILALAMGILHLASRHIEEKYQVWVEELGRGAFIIATLPIMFIGLA